MRPHFAVAQLSDKKNRRNTCRFFQFAQATMQIFSDGAMCKRVVDMCMVRSGFVVHIIGTFQIVGGQAILPIAELVRLKQQPQRRSRNPGRIYGFLAPPRIALITGLKTE